MTLTVNGQMKDATERLEVCRFLIKMSEYANATFVLGVLPKNVIWIFSYFQGDYANLHLINLTLRTWRCPVTLRTLLRASCLR